MIGNRDSWVLARLLTGSQVNGELAELSPPFQAIGRRLDGLALGDRQPAWDAFLDGRDDRRDIIQAVADANPTSPIPEAIEPEEEVEECGELWPFPPDREAYHGIIGDIVAKIEPQTEADPVAILGQLIIMFGNMIGRASHFVVEADIHHGNEFLALVGSRRRARKALPLANANALP